MGQYIESVVMLPFRAVIQLPSPDNTVKAGVNLRPAGTASIAELKISSKVAIPSPLVSIKSKSSALFSWSKRWNPIA